MSTLQGRQLGGLRLPGTCWILFEKYAAKTGCGYSKKGRVELFDFSFKAYPYPFIVDIKFVTDNIPNLCVCRASEQLADCVPCF